ncbi:unnamed protein product, partial [Oppiella nova]
MKANGKIVNENEQKKTANPGPGLMGLIGFTSNVFLLLSIVDSIVHIVKEEDYRFNGSKDIKRVYIILSSFVYSISLSVILILSCLVVDFNNSSISLICHIIASFLGLALSIKLVMNRYGNGKTTLAKVLKVFDANILAIGTLFSVILAVVIGIILREINEGWDPRSIKYVGFIGELFLRILKGLVLPLIFTSLVYAMSDIDTKLFGKIGFRTVAFYLTTTVLSIILGIILVMTIQPGMKGEKDKEEFEKKDSAKLTTIDTILDLIRNLFPDNLVEATFASYTTVLTPPNGTDGEGIDMDKWTIGSDKNNSMNILGVVVFAVVFGVIIGRMRDEAQVVADFFKAFNNAMMALTVVIIQLTPLAVLFLVLPKILEVDDLSDLLGSVGWYTLTVIGGIAIHGLIILPLIYFALTRKNPYTFVSQMSAAMMTAFGTGSSTATMPACLQNKFLIIILFIVTFECLEKNLGIDKRIVRFCIPVGATINMDGTALYEAVAAIFIAQYRDVELDIVKIIV